MPLLLRDKRDSVAERDIDALHCRALHRVLVDDDRFDTRLWIRDIHRAGIVGEPAVFIENSACAR